MGWKGFILGGPIGYVAEQLLKNDNDSDQYDTDSVSDTEVERIHNLIQKGRENGTSSIEIEISDEFARNIEINGKVSIETIPINVGAKVQRDRNGKFILKVDYLPIGATDKIKELHRMFIDGILTEDEFTNAKLQVLKSI